MSTTWQAAAGGHHVVPTRSRQDALEMVSSEMNVIHQGWMYTVQGAVPKNTGKIADDQLLPHSPVLTTTHPCCSHSKPSQNNSEENCIVP